MYGQQATNKSARRRFVSIRDVRGSSDDASHPKVLLSKHPKSFLASKRRITALVDLTSLTLTSLTEMSVSVMLDQQGVCFFLPFFPLERSEGSTGIATKRGC